ncbi:MAG: Rpn family recombination-promoting nuclease/putative transposase [Gemmatimonadota bacterium]|nr:Rpn family recombination-promoting nuclease/putative transposase [Gemmatimonadota bacterium]
MHDAFLKSVFADRRMAEILIRRHAPEWASEIDFSTLREEPSGLVSRKTLQRRHPDMIWSAAVGKRRRVLFLLEFQRTVEPLMALRTTTYAALTLEGIAAGPDFRAGDRLPEFVYFVLYHGDGRWTAPTRVTDLLERSDPARYRLVPWSGEAGDDPASADLTALVLGLARDLSPPDMAEQLAVLWRALEGHGTAGLEGFIHGPDGGHDVRVEGLPGPIHEGRSDGDGGGDGQIQTGYGGAGPEGSARGAAAGTSACPSSAGHPEIRRRDGWADVPAS